MRQCSRVYAHDWQVGDLVMFDTLGTLHRRDAWDSSARRVMRQISTLWTPPATVSGMSSSGRSSWDGYTSGTGESRMNMAD